MTTLNLIVSADDDDAEEKDDGNGFNLGANNMNAHAANNARFNSGFRFQSVTIPLEAEIESAVWKVVIVNVFVDDANIDIYGNDVDDSANFTDEADVTSRTLTTATVSWIADGITPSDGFSYTDSPELKTVVQEVIDRSGWSSGNALMIMGRGRTDANKNFQVQAHEAGTGIAAKLDIDYSDFPVVKETTTSKTTTAGFTHTVNLPGNIRSGNLLIVGICVDSTPTVVFPAGYTSFFAKQNLGANVKLEVAYRQADGGEGATISVITTASVESSETAYRIANHEDPSTQAPEGSSGASGTSTTPDPDSLTPTGGSKKYLWLAYHGHDGNKTTSAFPTSYSNGISTEGGNASSTGIGSAELENEASSEDPGTFTISGSDEWAAGTMAIHPVGAAAAARRIFIT